MRVVAPARILVVAGDGADRSLLYTMLSGRGYEVETTSSPSQALQSLRHGPCPDLLLAEMLMPEMSGLVFATRITSDFPSIPVVLMSWAVTRPVTVSQATIIPKPIRPSDLFAVVEQALQWARAIRGA